jgi:bacteriocin-like protein
MNQEETKEAVPENTTPVDEIEISDTELENISGGTIRIVFSGDPTQICGGF